MISVGAVYELISVIGSRDVMEGPRNSGGFKPRGISLHTPASNGTVHSLPRKQTQRGLEDERGKKKNKKKIQPSIKCRETDR